MIEAKNILTKVYGVADSAATAQLLGFATGPAALINLDLKTLAAALPLADLHGLDLTDAVLLQLATQHGASCMATEDQRLAQACRAVSIAPVSPLDFALRQQVVAWEAAHLNPKGLPRILRRVHQWLSQTQPQAAQDFLSQTGGGNHLP